MVPGLYDPATLEALSLPQDLGIQNLFKALGRKAVIKDMHDGAGGNYGVVIKEIKKPEVFFYFMCLCS